uniref:Uncharacterized protein n=1 Tax=Ascaris lumbricoides TaxID=6252 RepID=A0A0M3HQZ1_ASCLU
MIPSTVMDVCANIGMTRGILRNARNSNVLSEAQVHSWMCKKKQHFAVQRQCVLPAFCWRHRQSSFVHANPRCGMCVCECLLQKSTTKVLFCSEWPLCPNETLRSVLGCVGRL